MVDNNKNKIQIKDIHHDIVDNYTKLLNSQEEVESYRYLLYGNVYNGKYKGQLLDCFGYAKEYQHALPFLGVVNRLALTDTSHFNKFVAAWNQDENSKEENKKTHHIDILLNIFNEINKNAYRGLNEKLQFDINQLSENIVCEVIDEKNEQIDKKLLNSFIAKIIKFSVKSNKRNDQKNDYFDLSEHIKTLLNGNLEDGKYAQLKDQINYQHILEIKNLKEKYQYLEKNTYSKIKILKKDINHYLLSLENLFSRRIKRLNSENTKNKLGICKSKYYVVDANECVLNESLLKIKKEIHAKKRLICKIASTVSFNLCIGEGSVAGVAMYSFLAAANIGLPIALSLAIITGIAGAFCNYFLVRDDTNEILNQFIVKKFLNNLKGTKKDLSIVLGSSSLATGFVYASLSAMQLYHGLLMPLFSALHLSHELSMILSTSIACFPVTFTAIGLASIFYFVISDFIMHDRWQDIKIYFYKNYLDLGWREIWRKQGLLGVSNPLLRCALKLFKLLLGITINLIITVASFGVFHTQGIKLLGIITNANFINPLSTVLTSINSVISTIFSLKKVNDFLDQITFQSIKTLIKNIPINIWHLFKSVLLIMKGFVLNSVNGNYLKQLLILLVKSFTYPIQILIGLIQAIVKIILDAPKCISIISPVIFYLSFFLLEAVLEITRAILSLTLKFFEWCLEKVVIKKIESAHELINNMFIYCFDFCKMVREYFFDLTSIILIYFNLVKIKSLFNIYTTSLENHITDLREAVINELKPKKSCHEKLKASIKQECNKNGQNLIQKSVSIFTNNACLFAKATTGINGIGQSALMMTGSEAIAEVLGCQKNVVAASIGISEFVYSATPNALAIEASFSKSKINQ